MIRSSLGLGRVQAGEYDCFYTDDLTNVMPPLIFCHPATGLTKDALTIPGQAALLRQLANHFTVGVGDFAGDNWGSSIGVARVAAMKTYMTNNLGTGSAPVTLVAESMGTTTALNFARQNPTLVRAVCAVIPALDIQDMYAFNRSNVAASINAAYLAATGTAWSGMSTAAKEPWNPAQWVQSSTLRAPMADVPVKLFYASNDSVTLPGFVTAFAAARPQTLTSVIGASDHTDQSLIDATPGVLSFVRNLR